MQGTEDEGYDWAILQLVSRKAKLRVVHEQSEAGKSVCVVHPCKVENDDRMIRAHSECFSLDKRLYEQSASRQKNRCRLSVCNLQLQLGNVAIIKGEESQVESHKVLGVYGAANTDARNVGIGIYAVWNKLNDV